MQLPGVQNLGSSAYLWRKSFTQANPEPRQAPEMESFVTIEVQRLGLSIKFKDAIIFVIVLRKVHYLLFRGVSGGKNSTNFLGVPLSDKTWNAIKLEMNYKYSHAG